MKKKLSDDDFILVFLLKAFLEMTQDESQNRTLVFGDHLLKTI